MPAIRMILLSIAFLAMLTTQLGVACAATLTLDFEGVDGAAVDGSNTGVVGGTAEGYAYDLVMDANNGVFNQTGSGFGINGTGSGDDTDALDNGATQESILFTFDTANPLGVKLLSIDTDRLTGSGGVGDDIGLISFFDEHHVLLSTVTFSNANTPGSDLVAFDGVAFPEQVFQPGAYFTLEVADGNGYGLEAITMDVSGSYYTGGGGAVPEPAAALLLLLGCAAFFGIRRRRR